MCSRADYSCCMCLCLPTGETWMSHAVLACSSRFGGLYATISMAELHHRTLNVVRSPEGHAFLQQMQPRGRSCADSRGFTAQNCLVQLYWRHMQECWGTAKHLQVSACILKSWSTAFYHAAAVHCAPCTPCGHTLLIG